MGGRPAPEVALQHSVWPGVLVEVVLKLLLIAEDISSLILIFTVPPGGRWIGGYPFSRLNAKPQVLQIPDPSW